MVKSWEAGLYYPLGSTVEYQGDVVTLNKQLGLLTD